MANLSISKIVNLVGKWNEDVVTDEILQDIATRARKEKGKKIKVKATETEIKLTRAKLFQETQSTTFPINNLQTVMQSPEFPRCVMFILTDPIKKYKILAFRCETDADAAQLYRVLTDIQSKVKSPNIELKKRENGNWTLRGRTMHNANMHMLEIFNEHKQPNGDVVVKANGDAEVVPVFEPGRIEVHTNEINHKDTEHYKAKSKEKIAKKDDDSDDDDNYVIETEVTAQPYVAAKIHENPDGNNVMAVTTKLEHVSVKDNIDGNQFHVYEKPQMHKDSPILPSHPVVYRATSSKTISSQPVVYSSSSRSYQPMHSALYTDPWAHRRVSRESSLIPTRVDGYRSNVKFDQQSILSNTSRLSRSHRLRSSELSIPTTVRRSIEYVYPRPVIVLRRGYDPNAVYRPRPASYHAMRTNELQIYREDDGEAAIFM